VQREVARLEQLGLAVSRYTTEGRRMIQVVDDHPLLGPLQALVDAEATETNRARLRVARSASVHPMVQPRLPAILAALHRAGAKRAVLFGSAAQNDAPDAPHDLDVLVRLGGHAKGRATRYFELRRALERASGLPVDLVEEDAIANPYLRDEIERTGVVLLAAA
jgi:predicted nucleotidyltransferase